MGTKTRRKDDLPDRIRGILKTEFPDETVDVSLSGIRDNVHVIVVSNKFDRMTEKKKQDYLWELIDESSLSEEEKLRISMVLPVSPKELR